MAVEKLNPMRVGIAIGVLWGVCTFLAAVYGIYANKTDFIEVFDDFYMGYEASWVGSFIGLVWGFIDGFLCGFFAVIIYNCLGKQEWLKQWD
ncbi:MAG: hypothetical protein J7L59_00970 [Nanoarchaeota archaeon]|nr:hypothetical protein [Nanoarchaeota archaeon]